MIDYVMVTGSDSKAREASRILGSRVVHRNLDLSEPQSLDIEWIAKQKARAAYEMLGRVPVIVEDTGLYVAAWNGLPGPLVKWFENTVGPEGIVAMLASFPDRTAVARTVVAVHDRELRCFTGELSGRIAESPRGQEGFGWDSIFVPAGQARTLAEMSSEEKDAISMRRRALEQFVHATRQYD